jgi:lyso-ornithine lipid O-acyltransferase
VAVASRGRAILLGMQLALARKRPESLALLRTGSRAARTLAFGLETWSRLHIDGPNMLGDERARELAWVAENACALHGVRARVRGTVPNSPAVLVANHISYFDPLIIASSVPCTAVAKREVLSWPCIGELCRRLGVLFVQREDSLSGARVLREARRALDAGVSVLVFPEGTTTRGQAVLPFKRGIFGLAALASVPIVPVALQYRDAHAPWVGEELFLPHYMRALGKGYTQAQVDFLEPLACSPEQSATELAERARAAIAAALAGASRRRGPVSSSSDGRQLAVV